MKIRTGFVSNSSSSSFCIPSCFLTDEQKEMILSLDSEKEHKQLLASYFEKPEIVDSDNNYSKNKEYHRIYQEMVERGEWDDSPWEIGEKDGWISGATNMWNGSIEKFMEKIGIDITSLTIYNEGHNTVHMATHPLAVEMHIKHAMERKKLFESKTEQEQKELVELGMSPSEISPFEMSDDEFEEHEEDFVLNYKDGWTYFRKKTK